MKLCRAHLRIIGWKETELFIAKIGFIEPKTHDAIYFSSIAQKWVYYLNRNSGVCKQLNRIYHANR